MHAVLLFALIMLVPFWIVVEILSWQLNHAPEIDWHD